MGLDARLLAIGLFDKDIIQCLDYPESYYKETKVGTTVLTTLFCCNTSSTSYELAKALDIDAWDFNTHCFSKNDNKNINFEELEDLAIEDNDVECFKLLLEKGFIFIFDPNG